MVSPVLVITPEPLIPFSIEILRSVMAKIIDSYYTSPREIFLFFYYPSDEYTSYLSTIDELEFYDEIDFFVLPTLARESFGLVLCEAMYSGVPTISTNNGAQGEIIENGISGILVSPNDAAAIAQNIKNLVADPAKYQQISLAGNKRVEEKFTLTVMTDNLNRLFSQLLKKN